jgi:hypothetical protein
VVAVPVTPILSNVSECESCGEPIAWLYKPLGARRNGLWRPVDPLPNPSGEYLLLRDGKSSVSMYYERLRADVERTFPVYQRYIDHALTCTPKGVHMVRSATRRAISRAALRPYEAKRERRRGLLKAMRPNE